ncbi:MAG: hypothetical protein KF752_02985 [Pirellulaceae bacterium]|nr:hypothetical protein [Pirellulaceae bacterium]
MFALARGCLEFVFVWLLAGAGLLYCLEPRFDAPGPLWGSLAGGFLVAAAWGLVRNAWLARRQAALIRDSLAGAIPLAGRTYAAIGRAVATVEPLQTPFRHKPCVLYAYELSEKKSVRVRTQSGSRTDTHKVVYSSGLAMTQWAVETQGGPVPVRGFPVPDQFEEQPVDTNQHYPRIREFVEQTEFTRVGKWEIGKMLSFASLVLRESSEPVREDLWFDGAEEMFADRTALQHCRLVEQAIAVNQPICVIGKYDQLLGGLVNDLGHGGLQVLAGEPEQGIKHLNQTAAVYLFFALIAGLAGTLGSFGMLSLRQRSLNSQRPVVDLTQQLLAAFQAKEWQQFTELLAQGASPDSRDSAGRPLLLAAIDSRQPSAIDALLAAGADVNAAQTGWNRRPIEAAFDRNQWDLVDRLQAAGATGDFVNGNTSAQLTVEIPELELLLHRYTQALDQSDIALMQAITDDWPTDYLESVGRGLYKDTRPVSWQYIEGYRRDDLATYIAEGRTRSGARERYVVTARLQQGQWKLRRDYWDEAFSFAFIPDRDPLGE